MGGAQAGEIAAKIAASVLRDSEPARTRVVAADPGGEPPRVRGGDRGRDARPGWARRSPRVVEDGRVRIGHVGDSRAYRVRGREARAADRRPLAGRRARPAAAGCSPRKPDVHPQRSVITASLGPTPTSKSTRSGRRAPRATSSCSAPTALTSMVGRHDDPRVVEGRRENLAKAARAARRRRQQGRRRGTTSRSSSSRSARASRRTRQRCPLARGADAGRRAAR
jgi:hypothetical protein